MPSTQINFALEEPTSTPLPGTLPLLASGLGAVGLLEWRRKRKIAASVAAA
jgi:hypothetical protein